MANLNGHVFEKNTGGGIGRKIPGAILKFVEEGTRRENQTSTDEKGFYRIKLKPGRYRVKVEHSDYENYSPLSGFIIVRILGSISNFFLNPKNERENQKSIFHGRVFERLSDRSIGDTVPNTTISFISEGSNELHSVKSDINGMFSIKLPLGRYFVTAIEDGFEPYSSEPGFFVLRAQSTIANIFLERKVSIIETSRFIFKGDRKYNQRTTL